MEPQVQSPAPKPPKRKRGRPTRLDEEQRKELCLMIRVGCSVRAAAAHLGIKEQVVRYARRKNAEFDEQVRKAERNRNLLALQNIANAGKKSWRASAWVLRSADPDHYDYRRQANSLNKRRLKETVTKLVN
jgi:hypothetical protein